MDEYNGIPYEEPEGTVWVEILCANRDTYLAAGRGETHTYFEPRLRLTTFPGHSYKNVEFVSLRGHRYTIDTVYAIKRIHGLIEDGRSYSKGLRHESGNEVPLKSAARPRLRALEQRLLARFMAEQPDWRAESRRLLALWELGEAGRKADTLRAELAAAEARMAVCRAELVTVTKTRQVHIPLTMVK